MEGVTIIEAAARLRPVAGLASVLSPFVAAALGAFGAFASNSKPTLPAAGSHFRKAENLRLVRAETKPRSRSVRLSARSLVICARSMGCWRMTLPERKSQVFSAPTDFSQEHTSELQSPLNLVCRLLLEKKKEKK